MFTGIIETTGVIKGLTEIDSEWRIEIDSASLDLSDVRIGDSIAVSGCCLTVVKLGRQGFSADVSRETLRCTTLGALQVGSRVNLEKAMQASDRFGGHIVSGHVDGVGTLLESAPEGKSWRLLFEAPAELARYIAAKGSICIDGTSLTVNEVAGNRFSINVIPHTQEKTVIGDYAVGVSVNLEVDVVARYLERLMQRRGREAGETGEAAPDSNIDHGFLEKHGFKSG